MRLARLTMCSCEACHTTSFEAGKCLMRSSGGCGRSTKGASYVQLSRIKKVEEGQLEGEAGRWSCDLIRFSHVSSVPGGCVPWRVHRI